MIATIAATATIATRKLILLKDRILLEDLNEDFRESSVSIYDCRELSQFETGPVSLAIVSRTI